jgi:valine dehydrogenase (NAD+)
MRACAQHVWGSADLDGRTVGISGVGKVGRRLVEHLIDAGAAVVVHDVHPPTLEQIRSTHPDVEVAASASGLVAWPDLDIYSPNALGGTLDEATASALTARIVCGGANNQLAHPGIADRLAERGVTFAPDYLVNAGGVIQVADELHGFDLARAEHRALQIFDTTLEVLSLADARHATPARAADELAEARMAAARPRNG